MDDNQKSCLGFSLVSGIGPVTFSRLVSHFGSASKAFNAPLADIIPFFRMRTVFEAFVAFRKSFDPDRISKKMASQGVWIMTQCHHDYPADLRNILDPPITLFGKGDRGTIDFSKDKCIGIVGTRKPTPYGRYIAEEIGKACAEKGMAIISGMATGIDTISHLSALQAQGKTAAVLGTGIDMVYPPENKPLHEKILKSGGMIVSEYPPGYGISRGMFVLRNRIIVGLSRTIVVVEGGEHSGSLITARYAAENGRDVYAVPGPVTSEMSIGPHILVREGARILVSIPELLSDLGFESKKRMPRPKPVDLQGEEKAVYELLTVQRCHVDEIGRKMGRPVSHILPTLSLLEVRGIIEKGNDGAFTVAG